MFVDGSTRYEADNHADYDADEGPRGCVVEEGEAVDAQVVVP